MFEFGGIYLKQYVVLHLHLTLHLFTYELDLEFLMYVVPHFIPLVFDVNYNENDPTYDPKDICCIQILLA